MSCCSHDHQTHDHSNDHNHHSHNHNHGNSHNHNHNHEHSQPTSQNIEYVCPMHPEEKPDQPGQCSQCGMNLESREKNAIPDHSGHMGHGAATEFLKRFWIVTFLLVPCSYL